MHTRQPIMLLFVTGAILGLQIAPAPAAVRDGGAPGRISVTSPSAAPAAQPVRVTGSSAGQDPHVTIKVLPAPSVTSRPTSTPAPPVTTPPPGGGTLPTTGTNGPQLAAMVMLGLAALVVGILLVWMAIRRRRRERTV